MNLCFYSGFQEVVAYYTAVRIRRLTRLPVTRRPTREELPMQPSRSTCWLCSGRPTVHTEDAMPSPPIIDRGTRCWLQICDMHPLLVKIYLQNWFYFLKRGMETPRLTYTAMSGCWVCQLLTAITTLAVIDIASIIDIEGR